MAHMVTCTKCGVKFDRDKIQAVKVSARRYAHHRCVPDGEVVPLGEGVDKDLLALEEYVKKLLGEDYVGARVRQQIKNFQQEHGYSCAGILKTLVYFYEVKGNSKAKANGGIGIVPFVYKDAYNYYYSLFLAQQANTKKDISSIIEIPSKVVTIDIPDVKIKKKLFNLEEELENE